MNSPTVLKVTLVQQNLIWENIEANLNNFSTLINSLKEETHVIILPEMFSTGFTMKPELYAQTMEGSAVAHLRQWAQITGAAVCGSLIIEDEGNYFNRFIWVEANGRLIQYNKAHLFRMGEEQLHYSKGSERIIINYRGWRITPFICYDLRFPVWCRRTNSFDYDLLIVVANWPEKRNLHWKVLPQARAIENQAFIITVNRTGEDGNLFFHAGDSCVFDPTGNLLFNAGKDEILKTIEINLEEVIQYRKSFPVGLDTDNFQITNECNDIA
ncbi:MAG: amidohydrolase [Bacteroidia bacterium]|nr:amidohydrolase [Bacteroidia bacterium]